MSSGRPDWYSSVAMHGRFAEAGELDKYITVNVDELGNMLALMTGKLGDAYTPIAVDAQGVMRANLVLQDLSYLKVSPTYGKAIMTSGEKSIIQTDTTEIFNIDGRGASVGGFIHWGTSANTAMCRPRFYVDGLLVFWRDIAEMYSYSLCDPFNVPVYLGQYEKSGSYGITLRFAPRVVFDTNITCNIYNPYGVDIGAYFQFVYQLIVT